MHSYSAHLTSRQILLVAIMSFGRILFMKHLPASDDNTLNSPVIEFSYVPCRAERGARTQGKHLHPGYSLRENSNHLEFNVEYADLPY
jgi:hypothetical protein